MSTGPAPNFNFASSPIQVGSLTDWSYVKTGYRSAVAIKTDGTLWAWGKNDKGNLGQGNTTDRQSPVQIGSATDWLQVKTAWISATDIQVSALRGTVP